MYIDTPVKRYSSGMTVRLGFAVAAHLEPEILVVDEVLAVGDVEFQKKAIGKMQDLSIGQGRTVLFVSHNMASVQKLCSNGILLENGKISYEGNVDKTIDKYLRGNNAISDISKKKRIGNGLIKIRKIEIVNSSNIPIKEVYSGQDIKIVLHYSNLLINTATLNLIPSIKITNSAGVNLINHHSRLNEVSYSHLPENGMFSISINKIPLPSAIYNLTYSLISYGDYLDGMEDAITFQVIDGDFYGSGEVPPSSHSLFLLDANWD
jgi:lipopolysaccharide transport system ATP-binding protein